MRKIKQQRAEETDDVERELGVDQEVSESGKKKIGRSALNQHEEEAKNS